MEEKRPASETSRGGCKSTRHVPFAVSLLAGMLAGALGVAASYPLDSIKTKLQVMALKKRASNFELVVHIIRLDGLCALYAGVSSTMIGQAFVKGLVFVVYEYVMLALGQLMGTSAPTFGQRLLAAAVAGAVASFLVTPIERIKVVMQADGANEFVSPLACLRQVIAQDGCQGLMCRGLTATLAREVPAYTFYLVSYDMALGVLLRQGGGFEAFSPLIGGAVAGIASWLPVYPIDVVKTHLQVEVGKHESGNETMLSVALQLWQERGCAGFWDGLTYKLARAVVNHAVAFSARDYVLTAFMRYACK
jgi:hypothetical protein